MTVMRCFGENVDATIARPVANVLLQVASVRIDGRNDIVLAVDEQCFALNPCQVGRQKVVQLFILIHPGTPHFLQIILVHFFIHFSSIIGPSLNATAQFEYFPFFGTIEGCRSNKDQLQHSFRVVTGNGDGRSGTITETEQIEFVNVEMVHELKQQFGITIVAIVVVALRWSTLTKARCIPRDQSELGWIEKLKLLLILQASTACRGKQVLSIESTVHKHTTNLWTRAA